MRIGKIFIPTLLLFILFTAFVFATENNGKADFIGLGFEFGMKRKQAIEVIKSEGRDIIEDTVDSKEIRTILAEGSFIKLPFNTDSSNLKTRLEFYDDKLMSSSLIFEANDNSEQTQIEDQVFNFLINVYGEPGKKEEVLQFTTWTWQRPNVVVILSTDPQNNTTKIQNIYEPVEEARMEKEIEKKQKGPQEDPAKQMFLDGDYSRPTQYKR